MGDRARKIDQGILITRFELPFNIWCGTCNAHIGMGVRYNAEKKKIGKYYSTPIFSFRCKCHLCSGWFEIQTDPQNTRYVVVSGARQKDEDWDPEENGGYAIHDTEGKDVAVDPLIALEKSVDSQNFATKVQAPRIEQLQNMSEHYNADPYAHSLRLRKRFREEKKVEKQKEEADNHIKARYGLPSELSLLRDDDTSIQEASDAWAKARSDRVREEASKRRKLDLDKPLLPSSARSSSGSRKQSGSSSKVKPSLPNSSSNVVSSLRARILSNTSRQSGVFSASIPQPGKRFPDEKAAGFLKKKG